MSWVDNVAVQTPSSCRSATRTPHIYAHTPGVDFIAYFQISKSLSRHQGVECVYDNR